MTEIKLKTGEVALVDDEDVAFLNQFEWKLGKNGYAYVTLYMHRLVAKTPAGLFTDHIDRVRLHNWKGNLRHATPKQNAANRSQEKLSRNKVGNAPTSRFRGVCKVGDRWRAVGYTDRKQKHLGYFLDEEAAHQACLAFAESS